MATTGSIVQEAVKEALKELKEMDHDAWEKIEHNQKELKVVTDDATIAATEEVNQNALEEFTRLHQIPEAELTKHVTRALSKRLPSDRIEMISKGLQVPTYRLNFRHENGTFFADITRGGEKFMDSLKLAVAEDFENATGLQIASIVVEAIFLIMSLIGIVVPQDKIAKVAKNVATSIMQSKPVVAAVNALKKIWSSGGSSSSKATAFWELVKKLWEYRTHGNVFWKIVKGLCQNMSWWDWAKTLVIVAATIVAAVASGGAAMVAKIILAIIGAYEFGKKIANLTELEDIRLMVAV